MTTLPQMLKTLGVTRRFDREWLVSLYVGLVSLVGFFILLYAAWTIPASMPAILLFALLGAFAEMLSVKLFVSSRESTVSVSGIVAMATILLFGPLAGVVIHLSSACVALLHDLRQDSGEATSRAAWSKRLAFNSGMWIIASAAAGYTYAGLGGQFGVVNWQTNLLPLIVAAGVDIGLNLVLLIGVVSLQTGRNPLAIWRQDFLWTLPITGLGSIVGGGLLAVAYLTLGIGGIVIVFLPLAATGYSFRIYASNMRHYVTELEELNQDLDEINIELLETLGAIIDADDMYTYGHSRAVTLYAKAIGEELGLSEADQAVIVRGGLIHDIGKIGIQDSIISKPDRLTDSEYEQLKHHAAIGAEIVSRMKGMQDLVPLVRNHHERWDGRGYPDGLKGEETAFLARILCVADSVEAMLSDRPYRATRSLDDVVSEVKRCSGTQFDPRVVEAFLAVAEREGSNLFKNSAAGVDQLLSNDDATAAVAGHRYAKKGMVQ